MPFKYNHTRGTPYQTETGAIRYCVYGVCGKEVDCSAISRGPLESSIYIACSASIAYLVSLRKDWSTSDVRRMLAVLETISRGNQSIEMGCTCSSINHMHGNPSGLDFKVDGLGHISVTVQTVLHWTEWMMIIMDIHSLSLSHRLLARMSGGPKASNKGHRLAHKLCGIYVIVPSQMIYW